MLDTAATGNYGDKHTRVIDMEMINPADGCQVGCANNGAMQQTAKGKLPFAKLPKAAQDVELFNDMHTPLLSGGKAVENGCQLVFDKPNAHILRGETSAQIRNIIQRAE